VVAWERGRQTSAQLRAPEGAELLLMRPEIDRNRFGRELPTSEARTTLRSNCPPAGLIFGRHECTILLRRRVTAGIDEYRAERISDYDFPHSGAPTVAARATTCPGSCTFSATQPANMGRNIVADVLGMSAAATAAFRSHPVTRRLRRSVPPRRLRPQEDKTPNHQR
jgi:hypothetical protein